MTHPLRCARAILLTITCLLAAAPAAAKDLTQGDAARLGSYEVLRSARAVYIRTKSVYFKPAALEQALVRRGEIQQWGLAVTRDEGDADLVIEVHRKLFTNIFVYTVLDPRTGRVVAGGKIGSLGGSLEGQIADSFVKRLRKVRPLP